MTDDVLERLKALREACPAVTLCDMGGNAPHAHVAGALMGATEDGADAEVREAACKALRFLDAAHRDLPGLAARLEMAEGLLRDMADLDGMPVPLVRRYREALVRIAGLDVRAVNARRYARDALEGTTPPDDDEEAERAAWRSFVGELSAEARTVTRRVGADSFAALEKVADSDLLAAKGWAALEEIYGTLAAFGHPRTNPGRVK